MASTLESLESTLLNLPTADRIRLLDRIVESLDADKARDAAWDTVAASRAAAIDSGAVQPITLDGALARLRPQAK